MSDEAAAELTTGERIRHWRERRGMTRPVLAGLVGRSATWLKRIETGEREIRNLPMLVRLAQNLKLSDVGMLTGQDLVLPVDGWGKLSHPAVPDLRNALHATLLRRASGETVPVDQLAGRVHQAWVTWHTSTHQRTEIGAVLPQLLLDAHASVKASTGTERRRAYVVMAEAYALAQQYAAHTTEPELYWLTVDRAQMAAEESDDPVMLAAAAWIVGNGLREQGDTDEALSLVSNAADTLRPRLEDGSDLLRGTYGALCLHAAVTMAKEGRYGDAWRWHDDAHRTAERLGASYSHPWTAFGQGNVMVHAVTISADLRKSGEALGKVAATAPATIPSTERRSRLYVDAARAQWQRKETAGALLYMQKAYQTSPEAVRYVPPARALVADLARRTTGALRPEAQALAEDVGVAA